MSAGRRRWGPGAVLSAAALAGACVAVDPAPNGIGSARLDTAPPSVAVGDSLRDSLGVPYRIHGTAFDANGTVVPTAQFRYAYVPFRPDTSAGALLDSALVVDSATGAVRAINRFLTNGSNVAISSGRVFARIGSTIQLADTIQIVPAPTAVVPTPVATTLRYDCTDDRPTLIRRDSAASDTTLVNAVGPFTLVVQGDSAGRTVGVRRWLVRWSIDSVPAAVPTVKLTTSGATVPAIAIVSAGDALLAYDTTASATTGTAGTSSVLLRIRPTALGPAYSADSLFRVTLRADVITGPGRPVTGSPVRGAFSVTLRRSSRPLVPNVASCPR